MDQDVFAKEILPINLEDEMRQSYLDYAMSVIVGRALPDVRDGLKPVHRRVLYAMHELGNDWNRAYKKSARIVGDVIGRYHPHGDTAVYDSIVRMAQPFSMRYCLVDGQGNFGSVDGDAPAAMRYTEVRMAKMAHQLLQDIDRETVDFVPNYDESEHEPQVLPTRLPNLLINGSEGIAVGMATKIPPHNLNEVVQACVALLDDDECDLETLMSYLPGPDFPTGGVINGRDGIVEAYRTGRGRIQIRAIAGIEQNDNRQAIVVTELPYQVNKARLIERIAELVKEKRLEGISELRDESDKEGTRIYIELKRGETPEVVLNNLYRHTAMQVYFGINMVALTDGQPRVLNLKQVLQAFLRHRREVVVRRTLFDLRKARERAHVLEGLAVALANIDPIIALIKTAPDSAAAKTQLLAQPWQSQVVATMVARSGAENCRPASLEDRYGLTDEGYYLSPAQTQAILELRLHRLTALEQDKILEEYRQILDRIHDLLQILTLPERLKQVIRDELNQVRADFAETRRTEIVASALDLSLEDLINPEDRVVTLSLAGYLKAQPLDDYRAQRRGGRGKSATSFKDTDCIDKLFVANTHHTLLCFSNHGKVYWKKVYEIPTGGRGARGRPVVNLLPLAEGERIQAVQPIQDFDQGKFLLFATAQGTVKKTPLADYSRPRSNGIIAIALDDGDALVNVVCTDGEEDIMLFSNDGKCIRFNEQDVRQTGRSSRGVRGMRLAKDQQVISLVVTSQGDILTATEHGYGKRTPVDDYRSQGRGGSGVIAIQTSQRNGALIDAIQVNDGDEFMLMTSQGTLVRTRACEVSQVGRTAQGVRLIRLQKGESLYAVVPVDPMESIDEDEIATSTGHPVDEPLVVGDVADD